MMPEQKGFYEFGPFRVDASKRLLLRDQATIPIAPKVFETLLTLVRNPGRVIEKDELLKAIWSDSFVEEASLATSVSALRKILGERPNEHCFIVTVPGRGYRFVADVRVFAVEKAETKIELHDGEVHLESRSEIASSVVTFENLASPVLPSPPAGSIAVLPFTNLSADKENEYFSDGLAEEILNALNQVEGLRVAARSSSFYFKGKTIEISEIAAKLHVASVLEGSVRRAGNRIRVTVQLVDVNNGFHLWSDCYDRQIEDLFDVQDQIARAITERFKVTMAGAVKRSSQNLEAYELYLKGRHYWHQRLPATVRLAIQCFENAIKLDPDYALAYTGLADCYGLLRVYGWVSAEQGRSHAHAAVTQAVTLAPSLWELNFSRGFYTFYFERGWRQAGRYFQKAIAINPRSSLSVAYYGLFLATEGRAEDSVSQLMLACQMDPLSSFIHGLISLSLFTLKRFDHAERMARHALELQPGYLLGLWAHALALCGLGRNEEAIGTLERTLTMSRTPIFVGALGLAYARAGHLDDATRLLHELEDRSSLGEFVPAFAILAIYIGQDDLGAIRRTLPTVLAEATPPFSLRATSGPFLETYGSNPEIQRLLFDLYGQ